MQLDFWNNPLVVTAMRLKYRRGSPGIWASLWVLGLLGLGGVLHHLSQANGFRFPTAYLIALLGLQLVVSAAIAVVSTSSSMNAEVVNRTLDFQKIVTLSPRAILMGKMIGEPALSYFLVLASIPLAAVCWGLGAASGGVILWLYVNLATFTLMSASFGLINSLTPPTQTSGRQKTGGGAGLIIMFAVIPQLLAHSRDSLETPGIGDFIKLFTPIGSVVHLWTDNAWNAQVSFWGWRLPSLVAAPVFQLAIAAWIVAAMSRRLQNAHDPLVSKPRSYAALAVLDAMMAGICFSQWRLGYDPVKLIYGFCLGHLLITLLVTLATTPRRAAVISWSWRHEGAGPTLRQLLRDDRADMRLALIVYPLIGGVALITGLLLPVTFVPMRQSTFPDLRQVVEIFAAMATVSVGLGMVYQLLTAATSRGGVLMFFAVLLLANVAPPAISGALQLTESPPDDPALERIISLSPVGYFALNLSRIASRPIGPGWPIGCYATLGALSYALLLRVLRRESSTVRRKLAAMGLGPAEANA